MPNCDDDPQWEMYPRHRLATIADWDSKKAHRKSAKPRGNSQYNPHHYGSDQAVEALEMRCWREGIVIQVGRKKYLHVGQIVGVCRGEETEYVFAECASGFVHGRPISMAALREMGIII